MTVLYELTNKDQKVYLWNPKKGQEDSCCADDKAEVYKLPNGTWILASGILIQFFKFFRAIFPEKKRIGSSFGVSQLHNAEEIVYTLVPIHYEDIPVLLASNTMDSIKPFYPKKQDYTSLHYPGLIGPSIRFDSVEILLKRNGEFIINRYDKEGFLAESDNLEDYKVAQAQARKIKRNKKNKLIESYNTIKYNECKKKSDCPNDQECDLAEGKCMVEDEVINWD